MRKTCRLGLPGFERVLARSASVLAGRGVVDLVVRGTATRRLPRTGALPRSPQRRAGTRPAAREARR